MLPELESFSFGDSPEFADDCSNSCSSARRPRPVGRRPRATKASQLVKRWIVKDGQGRPSAILETVELKRRRFGDVAAAFAHDEGEGDRPLADWRRMHTAYFTRRGEFSPDMELYCERFTLIEVLEGERRGDVAV